MLRALAAFLLATSVSGTAIVPTKTDKGLTFQAHGDAVLVPHCNGRGQVTVDGVVKDRGSKGPLVVKLDDPDKPHDVSVEVKISTYEKRIACSYAPRAGAVVQTGDGLQTIAFASPSTSKGGGEAVVFVPGGHDRAAPAKVLVGVHPWNGSPWTYAAYEELLDEAGKKDVVLLMPSGLGNSLYVAEAEDEVMRAIDALGTQLQVDPQRVSIWGASMGGAGATTISFHRPDRFAFVASYFGDSRYDLTTYVKGVLGGEEGARKVNALDILENARWLPVFLVHGEDDHTSPIRQSTMLYDAMKKAGFSVDFERVPGMGHEGPLVVKYIRRVVDRAATAVAPIHPSRVSFRSVRASDTSAYGVTIVRASATRDAFVDLDRRAAGIYVLAAEGVTEIVLAPGALGGKGDEAFIGAKGTHSLGKDLNAKQRTWLVVLAPLVAVATLVIGLRVGAGNAFNAALVYAAAPGKPLEKDGPAPYSWTIMTYLEDRGVRETVPMKGLTVVARTVDGQESRWTGSSNEDGIAEAHFELKHTPAKIGIQVSVAGEREPLAFGLIDINDAPIPQHPTMAEGDRGWGLRPSKREGVELNLYVEGERLAVAVPTSIWVHVHPPARSLHVEPDIGVQFESADVATTCGEWAELRATAFGQAASTLIEASGDGPAAKGTWFGPLPTAPGGFAIEAPRLVYVPEHPTFTFVAPNPRTSVYVEIDDEEGRDFAAALPLVVEPPDPLPRAHLLMPDLADGIHWLVASGDPRGAEHMGGATLARPFMVVHRVGVSDLTCSVNTELARRPAVGFPKFLALDGIATRGAQNRSQHRQGLFIGLIALAAAALLEVLLLTAASREARIVLALAENDDPTAVTTKTPGGGLIVALLVALLGFALLAALMVAKA